MKLEEMSAKDLFLAFCEKAGIGKVEVKHKTGDTEFTLCDCEGQKWVDFWFDKDDHFIQYDIGEG